MFQKLCNWAADQIKGVAKDSKIIGDLYAGDIEHRGVEYYFGKAFKLGQKLGQSMH